MGGLGLLVLGEAGYAPLAIAATYWTGFLGRGSCLVLDLISLSLMDSGCAILCAALGESGSGRTGAVILLRCWLRRY